MADISLPLVSVEALPAGHGDCLLIEVGGEQQPWRLLLDGGTTGTCARLLTRLQRLDENDRHIDLFVVSHIDSDHIGGAIQLFERRAELGLSIGEVWFNGRRHLPPEAGDRRGALQGDRLSKLIEEEAVPWNQRFGGSAVVIEEGHLYRVLPVADGIEVVLLSPTSRHLVNLRRVWDKEVSDSEADISNVDTDGPPGTRGPRAVSPDPTVDLIELAAQRTDDDTAEANGSSIAFLLRLSRRDTTRSLLLTGDAHPSALTAALWQYAHDRGTDIVHADVFKLPHHASQANVTRDLLRLVATDHYVVSTSGAYFGHPDPIALARVAVDGSPGATVWFNYEKPDTEWFRSDRGGRVTKVPASEDEGVTVRLF